MVRESIKQATCENCDDEEAEFAVTDKNLLERDISVIRYDVRCSCGESGSIFVDENGVSASDGINYDDASWNQESNE